MNDSEKPTTTSDNSNPPQSVEGEGEVTVRLPTEVRETLDSLFNSTPLSEPLVIESGSAEETFYVAEFLAEHLTNGAVFLLSGDLGAGKTVFAKGIAAGLGIDPEDITSPTFTLVNVYQGRLPLYHLDLYRLESVDAEALGLDEILEGEKNVVVIEWAERLAHSIEPAWEISLEYVSEERRKISVRPGNQMSD